ncbi:dihydrodipicolinate synthase family protein [Faecalibacterium sp. An121]|uniref:dihydrodipicolinate synthase family protein n=1 Tax=Faecalibacterium sp. An121 TaxID=1965550 RepID=UPI000B3838D3|nr:dihydrodipicolinate synthase family protein [Faecalibacterium sp. An121]OUQ38334.1 hypothetical protein B5E66_06845 [Faecalibacterium sp. An121]
MKAVEIKGIIPPIITPMNEDESINVAELRAQVNRQIEGGVHAIFCFGTNGEGYILNGKEKELVLRTVIEECNGRVPVYAGTGGIAGCANVYPHTMASIYDLFMEGRIEEAKAANASIASFRACFKYGNPNTIVKTAVAMLGYNVGKCRAPFNQVPEEGIKALEKVLKENAEKGMC